MCFLNPLCKCTGDFSFVFCNIFKCFSYNVQNYITMAKQNVRMTAQDYLKEYKDQIVQQGVLKGRIEMRLLTLCKQNPEAIVGHMNDTDIKAKSLTPQYISRMHTEDCIATISRIEKWLEGQQPVVQGNLFN
jgi:hypothetical protein